MSKIIVDLSGQLGLLERHQGDLNDTSAVPNLRYIGEDGTFADGLFNPFKTYGYMSPANNTFAALTGTIAAPINSIQYEPTVDVVYLSEEGENILKLDGLDDTSLTNYLSVSSGSTIKDMLLYELNGNKSLIYVTDSNLQLIEAPGNSSANLGGMYVGFKTLDTTEGATVLEKDLKAVLTSPFAFKIRDASTFTAGTNGRRLTQEFYGADVQGKAISGISIAMRRSDGTGVGITMRVSIQSPATASTGIYTSRGAWSNAVVNYVTNDTVTNLGITYQCILAHSASATANDEPGVGSNWEDYWNVFGSPDGTVLASGDFLLSSVPVLASNGSARYTVEFSTPVTGLSSSNYWIVIEEVGSNMTASDSLEIVTSINGNGIYDGYKLKSYRDTTTDFWRDAVNLNGSGSIDNMDFRLIMNRDDNWTANTGTTTNSMAVGFFGVETGKSTFLYLADNGLVYWFTDNKIHTLDGSVTGGQVGKVTENVLQFPSYITAADVTETRSRMYIGVQMSNRTTAVDNRNFGANKVGVYIWDRRSQILGASDFYPCPGAKEIRSVFTSSSGDVLCITIGNSGFAEIRGISGNQYAVLHTFEKNGYPKSRKGVSQIDNMTTWLGANGTFYAYGSVTNGQKAQLYKIGTMQGEAGSSLAVGPIFVGHEESSEPRSGIIFGWQDSTATGFTLVDSYSESNYGAVALVHSGNSTFAFGQSFVGTRGTLGKATFYLYKTGTISGTVRARLYLKADVASGTAVALATSATVNVSSLTVSVPPALVDFTFSDEYQMEAGVEYVISLDGESVSGLGVFIGTDNSAPTHTGQGYTRSSANAWSTSAMDCVFYVYTTLNGHVSKWYPNGDGTISSVEQKPNQGDIYTKVYTLPSLSTLKYARLMMAPGVATGTTTIANLKCYFNQSTTAAWTKAITLDDIKKGWKNMEINKSNINFVQFEIEYLPAITLGDSDFKPMYIELEYTDENRINP